MHFLLIEKFTLPFDALSVRASLVGNIDEYKLINSKALKNTQKLKKTSGTQKHSETNKAKNVNSLHKKMRYSHSKFSIDDYFLSIFIVISYQI